MTECLEVGWRRARAWLERVRAASATIEPLVREIAALTEARDAVQPWRTSGSGVAPAHGTHSDPTATEAERRITELEMLIDSKRRELAAHQDVVGALLSALDTMGRDLTDRHAKVIELYYVDLAPTWSYVAFEMDCDRATVWRLRSSAYAWIELHCQKFFV